MFRQTLTRIVVVFVAAIAVQGCGCTTYSNRLCIGRRPHLSLPLKECDLRAAPNPALSKSARLLGFLTTPFKRAGVLGWRDMHVEAVAVGVVQQIATSTDHFVTADLCLLELTANGTPVALTCPRYLRAEICARKLGLAKARLPSKGDKVRVAGRIMWDSDGNGFLEIHPQAASDVEILGHGFACGVGGCVPCGVNPQG